MFSITYASRVARRGENLWYPAQFIKWYPHAQNLAVETFPIAEEVTGEGSNNAQQVEDPRNKIRRRSDDEDADVPLPKRQATQRRLRSRDKKRIMEQKAVTGKVVARGKGWITVESGSDDK
ncbi:hypothetical protein C8R47DRAFT_1202123 [Mycena vitilis]|nr:hypothetical protein C8R47DRAFT_1202123 [Mycena vitilis]